MKLHELLQGLIILSSYDAAGVNNSEFHAEHDVVYFGGPNPTSMKEWDANRLRHELGFDWSDDYECWVVYV